MPINTHPFTSEDVMAYLDGELSPKVAAEMTAHLSQCRACQDVAAELQVVSRQLSGWTIETPEAEGIPTHMGTALEERAAVGKKKIERTGVWYFVAKHPWAIAAGAIFCVGWFVLPHGGPHEMSRMPTRVPPSAQTFSLAPLEQNPPPPESKRLLVADQFLKTPEPPPLVVRTADLRLTAHTFDTVQSELDRILLQFGGHIAQLNVASPSNEARSLSATLRIPAPQLDVALTELRKLGRVDGESQRGEEVTQQSVDLEARLANSRHTEQRLTQILSTRTGNFSDVLEVDQKLAEVRGEIEQAEAEQKSLNNRISFATVSLQVSEDYRGPLTGTIAPSIGTQLSNSATNGLHSAFDAIIGTVQFFLTVGPTLLVVSFVLGLPGYFLWKKLRHH